MKTKNGHILTFSDQMQIFALLCFATCDWFCPMMSLFTNSEDFSAFESVEQSFILVIRDCHLKTVPHHFDDNG